MQIVTIHKYMVDQNYIYSIPIPNSVPKQGSSIKNETIETISVKLSRQISQLNQVPISVYDYIYKVITSQDFRQKTNMVFSVSIELYRVMVSSLLLIFIPQRCENNNMCTIMENITTKDNNYNIGLVINYITMGCFLLLYITETRREEKLIKLLEVNNRISSDNESVGKRLEMFPENKRKLLFSIDNQYKNVSYLVMCMFIINTIYSWGVIYEHSLGNQTLFNFVTNILFMLSKLTNIVVIIRTKKNVFFSAYLNTKVQFNDIDPMEMKKINKQRQINAMTSRIAETGGWCLMEENKIQLLDEGGFEILDSGMEKEIEMNKIV